ncbi:hypothetical protein G5B38_07155 [Pseudohalocynthiibacter aestuariivivens]|nr:hypothetical protein [Pseudohalocynthiibacter aestuariivivens]QIE45320.1 hypothetical protein G5B38_07155 [Pseudohalocynthiibacter aestuariivivens]
MKPVVESILKKAEEAGFSDILEASERDVEKLCKDYCFDLKDLARRLRLNNHATRLLTAHLALDHTLSVFLSQQFVAHAAIDVDRWAFAQKVDLLYSLGLIDKGLLDALLQINKLRNKAAHKLNFKVSSKDVDAVIRHCRATDGEITGRLRFAEALLTTLLHLDGARSYDVYRQTMAFRAKLNARRVLAETAQGSD